MKKIMQYLSKNIIPITLGIGIGLAIAFVIFNIAFRIIHDLWIHHK